MPGSRRPVTAARKSTRPTARTAASTGSATDAAKSTRLGKFNAKGERVNGIWMASEAEAERYRQLLRLEMYGAIERLETQPLFDLTVNNRLICRYRADFRYDVVTETGRVLRSVTEDIKGFVTPEFTLKLKLFNALHVPELTVIKPGQVKGSRALYLQAHWDGVIGPEAGEYRTPPEGTERIEMALASTA